MLSGREQGGGREAQAQGKLAVRDGQVVQVHSSRAPCAGKKERRR